MKNRRTSLWKALLNDVPRIGTAGSRSSQLHLEDTPTPSQHTQSTAEIKSGSTLVRTIVGHDLLPEPPHLNYQEMPRFAALRWMGTVGVLLISLGGLGAGATPVVNNPYPFFPGGQLLSRMLQTSSVMVMVGVGLLVTAWVLMAPFTGASLTGKHRPLERCVSLTALRRTLVVWILPLIVTAPLFTQDIYSYLAQGSIVQQGMDPYAAGPIDLLGPSNLLARSVPFIWAHSPSPYGPVALGIAAGISQLTQDSVVLGVICHRIVSSLGIIAAGWGVLHLSRRCHVNPSTALWLGILNPLTLLHLIGGIHNEALMMGLILVGIELSCRGADALTENRNANGSWLIVISAVLVSCAGMVKVTGFLALGFAGMILARSFMARGLSSRRAVVRSALIYAVILVLSVLVISAGTGIGLGWITGQGGAATIRSWMSITTLTGVCASYLGMLLGLGDHSDAILIITRGAGIAVAIAFLLRMLFASLTGKIHPLGGFGVSTFVLVILFPVINPWYALWAIIPLSAWANRPFFRACVVLYSTAFSFFVLPRGLGLPPITVLTIYTSAFIFFVAFLCLIAYALRRRGILDVR